MFLFQALRDVVAVLLVVSGIDVPLHHDANRQFRSLSPLEVYIAVEAVRNRVDPALALAIVYQESRFKPSASSPTRDFGLFQLHCGPRFSWCRKFGVSPRDLLDPRRNVALGLAVVKACAERARRCEREDCPHLLHYFNRGDAYRRSVLRHADRYRRLVAHLFRLYDGLS